MVAPSKWDRAILSPPGRQFFAFLPPIAHHERGIFRRRAIMEKISPGRELDAFDVKILRALQENGRLSSQELAARVGLSLSPCWRRVRSLEARGIIERYVALVDARRVGASVNVWVQVSLEKHVAGIVQAFERAMLDLPEVLECYSMTGEADYLLRVVVGSVEEYERFLWRKLFALKGVTHVNSKFALKQIKYDTALPLGET
jgi:DNA-binding Lrp family transcriptional regulator